MSRRRVRKKLWPKQRLIKLAAGLAVLLVLVIFLLLDVGGPLVRSLAGVGSLGAVLFTLWIISDGGKGNGPYSSHTGGMWGKPSA